MRLAPGTIPSDADKDQSQGSPTDSSRDQPGARADPPADEAPSHLQNPLHYLNNKGVEAARPGRDK